jgi:amino acid transporter
VNYMQRIKQLVSKSVAGATLALSSASVAMAAVEKPELNSPTKDTSLADLITTVINALLIFAGAVAVLFLIIGGFRYVVSAGNADQVEGAKKTILYAIVGLIIIFVAFVLVQLIQNWLGVTNQFKV